MFARSIVAVGLLFGLLSGKDKPSTPVVSPEFRARIWRAKSEVHATALNVERSREVRLAQQAESDWVRITKEWSSFCGEGFKSGADPLSGEPSCVKEEKKPEPPKP